MAATFIPFTGWNPSSGYFGEGWAAASNLYPSFATTRPLPSFQATGAGIAEYPLSTVHVHRWMSGAGSTAYLPDEQTLFTGGDTHLYTVDTTGTFTDVSRAALYGPNGAAWRFASVGNDIWAVNWIDQMQRRTNNAGLFANGVVSTFKPIPRFIAPIREHLVVANLNQAGRFQDEVAWSTDDDATNFDPATATSISLAGKKRLTSVPGQITGLLGGQYGLTFKRRGIFYLEYTGTSQVLRPDILSPHHGTAYPSSIVNSRYGVFFLGGDGFYRIVGLSEPQKVSPPGVDQILLDTSFTSFSAANYSAALEDGQIFGVEHPHLPLIGWVYKAELAQIGASSLLLYNPATDMWSTGGTGGVFLSSLVARPYSSNIYNALAGISTPPGGGTSSKYSPWSSVVQAAAIQLRYRPADLENAEPHQQSLVYGVLPVFSKVGGTASTALTESVTVEALRDPHLGVTAQETMTSSVRDVVAGHYPFMVPGRFFKVTINCAAEDFANFEGVYIWQRLLT